jgi:signal transduction histidine kinase
MLTNASIGKRLTHIIMLISFVSVFLTTLAISVIGVYRLQSDIIKEMDVSATLVGDRNTAALLFNDDKQANDNLNVFSVNPAIVQACLYNPQGAVFARYVAQAFEQNVQCPVTLGDHAYIKDKHIELMKPVIKNGDTIGFIYLESTLDQIDRYIKNQILIAVLVAFAALIVSYLLAVRLQRSISRPILSLADTAQQVSLHKDYSIRAVQLGSLSKEYNNELVILTHAFNEMLMEIDSRDTQLKLNFSELEKAKNAAESANLSKSQFLANISHELRTPLNAIIGFSSILMNQLFGALGDQKYLEYAKDINDSGAHLLDIINDILDLSKAEAGKLTLNYEEIQVSKVVSKSITILSERAAQGSVSLTSDVPKSLPFLVADRLRILQILLNLLSNGVKFTEAGGRVHVAVSTRETAGEITHLIITCEDTGIGMSSDDLDKAFQSFGQVDGGLNRKYEGTGLGLPLTKKLMELHFGRISITSELGNGTIVTLELPILPPPEAGYVAE